MSTDVARGRRLTLAIAVWVGVIPALIVLLAMALSRRPAAPGAWSAAAAGAAINLFLAWLLYKAVRWTRIYIALSLFVAALLPTVRILLIARGFTTAAQFIAAFLILLPRLINLFVAIVLWRSPSIAAYFERENEIPALRLTS